MPFFGAVIYAKQLALVTRFYERVLGFDVRHRADDHIVLGSAGFELVVVEIPAHIPVVIESPPVRREATPIKLIFVVPSIAESRTAVAEAGGVLDPVEREWQSADSRVCDGLDPEGNVFQLRQQAGSSRISPTLTS